MDPKMDTGFLAPGETMDDDYDLARDLLPEEVLGIIDQLICFEVRIAVSPEISATADKSRWAGIWATPSHKQYLLVSILTTY
jgi:hypothetical protein